MAIRWVMLGVLFVVRLAMGYQFQSVASVSSALVHEFGFSYAQVGTLIGFFLLPGIVVAIPSGLMTRAMADKNLLMLGAATMVAGGVIMGLAETPSALYTGRLVTGIGGTIFNVILTKMVTEWFFKKEIVTALSIMLTAWPIGIVLGLHTQAPLGEMYGWNWVMHATAGLALVCLVLTLLFYREAPVRDADDKTPLRFGLPRRQFVHMGVVGVSWTLYNGAIILVVSFSPDALVEHGYDEASARIAASLFLWVTLLALPLGGRLVEMLGHITLSIVIFHFIAALAILAIAQGLVPELSFVLAGIFLGIPGGALMALSAEAVRPENRGPGLGVFYTWYYVGMTLAPALAGWTRDVSGSAASPIILAAGMVAVGVLFVGVLRLMQRNWPIEGADGNSTA
ncbi:MAG: MFS transporter [Alphaproteobacteria bacterium]|nr:MFS transporter [Alphaproteobacteria bacterium]